MRDPPVAFGEDRFTVIDCYAPRLRLGFPYDIAELIESLHPRDQVVVFGN